MDLCVWNMNNQLATWFKDYNKAFPWNSLCAERVLLLAKILLSHLSSIRNCVLRTSSNSMPDVSHVAFLLSYAADLYQQRRQWENQQRRTNHPNRQDFAHTSNRPHPETCQVCHVSSTWSNRNEAEWKYSMIRKMFVHELTIRYFLQSSL